MPEYPFPFPPTRHNAKLWSILFVLFYCICLLSRVLLSVNVSFKSAVISWIKNNKKLCFYLMITDCNLYSQTYVLKNNIYKWLPTEKHSCMHVIYLLWSFRWMIWIAAYVAYSNPYIFIVRSFLISLTLHAKHNINSHLREQHTSLLDYNRVINWLGLTRMWHHLPSLTDHLSIKL